APVMVLVLIVALYLHKDDRTFAFIEWVKLLHVYTSMIVLGGGIFIFLVFQISDHQPTALERIAAGSLAPPLYSGWKVAALMQLITGSALVWLENLLPLKPWVSWSAFFYLVALALWWLGFHRGFDAERSQALYRDKEIIELLRRERDLLV